MVRAQAGEEAEVDLVQESIREGEAYVHLLSERSVRLLLALA